MAALRMMQFIRQEVLQYFFFVRAVIAHPEIFWVVKFNYSVKFGQSSLYTRIKNEFCDSKCCV
jgi:hypothetical protein